MIQVHAHCLIFTSRATPSFSPSLSKLCLSFLASRVRSFNLELSPNTHADRGDSFLQLGRLLTAHMTLSQILCVCLAVACKNYIFPQVLQQHFYHHHVFTFIGPTGKTSIINCEINSSPAERDSVSLHRNPPVGPSSWACDLWSCAGSCT